MDNYPALILAAGRSQRMGFPKALLSDDGQLCLHQMMENLSATGWAPILIILSDSGLTQTLANLDFKVKFLLNPHPERGMISSLRIGIGHLDAGATGLLALPVDHPLVMQKTLRKIKAAAAAGNIVVPRYNGRRGHPTWWGRDHWKRLMSVVADKGAHAIVRSAASKLCEIDLDDAGVIANLNRPEDAACFNLTAGA